MKARVTYYPADGCGYEPRQIDIDGEYSSVAAAREAILDEVGEDFGSWIDCYGNTCYHESEEYLCGGYSIELIEEGPA